MGPTPPEWARGPVCRIAHLHTGRGLGPSPESHPARSRKCNHFANNYRLFKIDDLDKMLHDADRSVQQPTVRAWLAEGLLPP
jgi:hypothetical protein